MKVVCGLAERLGAEHPGFAMSARELIDRTLCDSGLEGIDAMESSGYQERGPTFEEGHFVNGFPNASGRFKFQADWPALGPFAEDMPTLPDHWNCIESESAETPMRMVAPPARMFLNTSFTETASSRTHETRPTAVVHPEDAARLGIGDGDVIELGNRRGALCLHAACVASAQPGTVIVEGIWPNRDFEGGVGINQLIGSDPVAPAGGVAFHDTAVWIRPYQGGAAQADPRPVAD